MPLDLNEIKRAEETLDYKILFDEREVGELRVYLATKEEAKSFKKYLKRQVKKGQPFSAKVFLDTDLDEDGVKSVLQLVEARFPETRGKVYLLKREGAKLSALMLR
jgi:hypothetical protein